MGSGVEVEIGIQQSLGGVGWGYRVAWVGVPWSLDEPWTGEKGCRSEGVGGGVEKEAWLYSGVWISNLSI